MSTGELLNVNPLELKFPFELKKQISCTLLLSNKTENHVAFKVKTTNPKKYCVRPNTGVVLPLSTSDIMVTMQAQKEAPQDLQCKDKFLLQSVVASPGIEAKDITNEMFSKQSGQVVEECKLRVVYLAPPQLPSSVLEESNEGASPKVSLGSPKASLGSPKVSLGSPKVSLGSPKVSLANSGKFNASEVSKLNADSRDRSAEIRSLISKLTDEKNAAIQQSNKFRQEMELLTRGGNKSQGGGVSIIVVISISLIGLIMGYLLNNQLSIKGP